jgi:thiamine biosynthesis lipoprotein
VIAGRLAFRAMASEIAVTVEPNTLSLAALADTPHWFADWATRLSRFHQGSELSALNRAAGTAMAVSEVLWTALRAAVAAAEATDGLITPALLGAMQAAGYDQSFEQLTDGPTTCTCASVSDFHGIAFDEAQHTVTLPAGMGLDLGGTAKGWAADVAAQRLAPFGRCLVNAGGDVSMSGPEGAPWRLGVESPLQPGVMLGVLEVERGGVATSGRYYRKWQHGGVWQHHLIDPRTGKPAQTDVVSATVVAPSALVAEVAAKQVLILGSVAGLAWLAQFEALAALVVLEDGTITHSAGLDAYWRS